MTTTISIPELFTELLDLSGDTAIEHADVNTRLSPTLLALAMGELGSTAILCRDPRTLIAYLSSWFDGTAARRHYRKSGNAYVIGDKIYVAHDENDLRLLGVSFFSKLIVLDAHGRRSKPSIRAGSTTVVGTLANRGHWFYEFAREEATHLISYDYDALSLEFPDLEALRGEVLKDPMRDRRFYVKDVELQRPPFVIFSRERLLVRTDKGRLFLNARQIAQAEKSLGPGWESGRMGSPRVSFYLSDLQKKYLAKKRLARAQGKKPWYLLLKYRRGGFTTIEQGLQYELCVNTPDSYVATLAHTTGSTSRIVGIAQGYHEYDPHQPIRTDDSSTSMKFENGSYFFIGTAGGKGFARGDTLQRVHGSEVSKWCEGPNQRTQVQDLLAAILAAASNGEVVLETTPNGRDKFCELYEEAKLGENEFTPLFLRWFDDRANRLKPTQFDPEEIVETLSSVEEELIQRHELDLAQIAFRRRELRTHKVLFPQEYPEDDVSCFISSGISYFDTEELIRLQKTIEPGHKKDAQGGYTIVWEEPQEGVEYAIGVDTSEGIPGCDKAGGGVVRKDNGKQVAAWHGYYSIPKQAELAVEFSKRYNNAILGIERENHGHAVLLKVCELGLDKPHTRGGSLFYFTPSGQDPQDKADARSGKKYGRPGWSTNKETRPVMLSELDDAVRDAAMKVLDLDFVSECINFRLQSNGRFEADSGAHDDTVMKWAIAWQMRGIKRRRPGITMLEGSPV